MTTSAPKLPAQTAIAAGIILAGGADGPPKRIQLLPMGQIDMVDDRPPFLLADAAHAEAVIAATRVWAGKRLLPVDYDHQSILAATPGVGGRAPAAGWFNPASLTVEADGVWADVEWTAAAAAAIDAKEYRYLSPVFLFAKEPSGNRVVRLTNAALTNNPGIHEMAALAAADFNLENEMDLIKFAAALGLSAAATEGDILAGITTLKAGTDTLTQVATAAAKYGVAASAGVDAIIATAVAAAAPDPAKFVPIEAVTALQAQVADINKGRAETAVASAMAAGKVAPALQAWATDFANKDPAGFTAWCAAAPVVLAPGEFIAGGDPPPGSGALKVGADGLDDTERALCSQMGISPARYLEVNKKKDA